MFPVFSILFLALMSPLASGVLFSRGGLLQLPFFFECSGFLFSDGGCACVSLCDALFCGFFFWSPFFSFVTPPLC